MWGLLGLPTVGGNTSPIRVGSICSGMMTEQAALSRLPWAFTKAFWCESDAHARRFIIDNIDEPGVPGWDNVMSEEFLTGAPPCDVLLAGFPCQPFSIQGKGEGLEAPASRGIVVTWILRYVKLHSPRIVILENVEGLVFRHRAVLNKVVSVLEQIGYIVSWRLLDTRSHGGIPCRRKRVYIVGIMRPATGGTPAIGAMPATGGIPATGGGRIVWPQHVQCIDLSTIFEDTPKVSDYSNYAYPPLCTTKAANLREAVRLVRAKAVRENVDPATYSVVVDLAGSKVQVGYGCAPCLTKARGAADAFFSLQHGRFLSLRELCRLQGLNVDLMKLNISRAQIGGMLGNGFTCTIIARVVAAAIEAAKGSAVAMEGLAPYKHGYDTP